MNESLENQIREKFNAVSTPRLIGLMEAAPDFGYDDESVELNRRLALSGLAWRWASGLGDRIEVFTPEAGDEQ